MRTFIAVFLVALVSAAAAAQDSRPESSPAALAKVEALQKQMEDLRARLSEDAEKIENDPTKKDTDALDKVVAEFNEKRSKIAASLLAIAEAEPKDPTAMTALRYALRARLDEKQLASALTILDGHALDEAVADVLPALNGYASKEVEGLLEKVIEQNPSRPAKGLACFNLAMRTRKEAAHEKLLERIVKEFADIPFRGDTLGAIAERRLFAVRNLQIGMKAPDLEGKDLDGVALKLSDYRGKVVVLDFWGFW